MSETAETPPTEVIMGDENKADLVAITFDTTLAAIEAIGKETAMTAIRTDDEFAIAKKGLTQLVTARTTINKRRLDLGRQVAAVKKQIDDVAGELTDAVGSYETPLRTLKDEWEAKLAAEQKVEHDKEMAILDAITARIELMENLPKTVVPMTALEAKKVQAQLDQTEITEELFGGRTERAHWIKDAALLEIKAMVDQKVAQNQAAKKLADTEAKQKAEAERQAEQKKKLDAQQAELDKAQKKIDEGAAEIVRLAEEKDVQEKADAKVQADKEEADAKAQTEKDEAEAADQLAKEEFARTMPDRQKIAVYGEALLAACQAVESPFIEDNNLSAQKSDFTNTAWTAFEGMKGMAEDVE